MAAVSSGCGAVMRKYHYDTCARVGPEGALPRSRQRYTRLHATDDRLVFNHLRLTPSFSRQGEGRHQGPTHKAIHASPGDVKLARLLTIM